MEANGWFGEAESRLDPAVSLKSMEVLSKEMMWSAWSFGMQSGGSKKGAGSSSGRRDPGGRVRDPDLDLNRVEVIGMLRSDLRLLGCRI